MTETIAERRARALNNALLASRLLDDAVYAAVIKAVKNGKDADFKKICTDQGIRDPEIRDHLWTLITWESLNQPTGVCW